MLTAFIAFLVILGGILYLHVGYHIGDTGLKLWFAKDNASLRAFLLFPVSFDKGAVGGWKTPWIESLFDIRNEVKGSTGPDGYRYWVMVIWPFKLLVNVPAILLYGGIRGWKAMRHGRAKAAAAEAADPEHLFPSIDDDLPKLFAKRQKVMSAIAALADKKKALDEELERRKSEIDAAFEVEGALDPEVRKMIEDHRQAKA